MEARCHKGWGNCDNPVVPGSGHCAMHLAEKRQYNSSSGFRKRYFATPHGRAMRQARVARRRGALWVLYDAHKIFQEHEYRCYLCGLQFEGPEMLTKEHVIPISKGGPDAAFNVLPACRSCNSKKKDRFLWELPFDPYDYPEDPNLLVIPTNGNLWTPNLLIPGTKAFEDFKEVIS